MTRLKRRFVICVLVFSSFGNAFGASLNGTATWADCSTTPGYATESLKIDPADIKKGETTTVTGVAMFPKAVASGTWTLGLTWHGVPLPVTGGAGSLCAASDIVLPLGGGTLHVSAFDCPLKAGNVSIPKLIVDLTAGAPPGDYVATLQTAANGEDAICAKIIFTL